MSSIRDEIRTLAEAIERESVLIQRDALVDIFRDLHRVSRFGVGRLINKAAEFTGKKGAKTLKEKYGLYTDRLEDAAEVLSILSESSRFLNYLEFDPALMEIRTEGSLFVEAVPQSEKPVCGPLAAFFKGFLTEFLEKPHEVKELRCQAQGGEQCVFRVIPRR
ncbi:MAG: 4-vinyl reductase [Aquificae bacterium]|nr:4-vinyl reductase [Aquificota bacterium]